MLFISVYICLFVCAWICCMVTCMHAFGQRPPAGLWKGIPVASKLVLFYEDRLEQAMRVMKEADICTR